MAKELTGHLSWAVAADFLNACFIRAGVPEEDAAICADVILESDRRGITSHGCNRLKSLYLHRILAGEHKPITRFEIVREGPAAFIADAHDGIGMVASYRTMEAAIQKAKISGICMAAVKNSSHYGIAGYYASMAVKAGMVGITGTNTRPTVAPTNGVQGMLGTNPLAVGIPTDEEFPFVLDCATSIIPRGKTEYYERVGKDVPYGAVVDDGGRVMQNAAEIEEAFRRGTAALMPLGGVGEETGGHKGFGLSTVIEVFCAAFQGGPFLRHLCGVDPADGSSAAHFGHFFLVIDPEAFSGADIFRKTAGQIMRDLRSSKRASEDRPILTAGEKEYLNWQSLKETGLPLNRMLEQDFISLRNELKIPMRFSFEL